MDSIANELAIYSGIEATSQQLEEALKVIQDFEPAGLGARDLRECLLIQLRHKKEQLPAKADDSLLRLETTIISD